MNYSKVAKESLNLMGGAENVDTYTHCSTRLRVTLKNQDKVDMNALRNVEGVLDVALAAGQTQLIVGQNVGRLYQAFSELLPESPETDVAQNVDSSKKNGIGSRILDTVSGIFAPLVPAITAAGLIKAVLAVMVLAGVSTKSQNYYILSFIADSAFYFFPVLVSVSAANKFKCNPFLAAMMGGILIHPNFTALVSAGKAVYFLGIPVTLASYASSVLPALLIVWFMSYIERYADRWIPTVVKAVLKPMVVILITAPIALWLLGPLGQMLGNGLAAIFEFLNAHASFLVPTIIGALTPLLVFFGMHHALLPLATFELATKGYETINGPGMLASNVAQGAATLAVALKTKDKKLRQIALSTGVTAVLGITEPALYGVTVKLKRPLIPIVIAGGLGGLFAGATGLVRYAFASPGLATLPVFIGKNPRNIILALITVGISFVTSFILTYIIGFDDPVPASNQKGSELSQATPKPLFSEEHAQEAIYSPLDGEVIALSEVPDTTFAQELVGKGVAVQPTSDNIYAPADGVISTVFTTKHAIGITTNQGAEILIHLGLETVELNGQHFNITVHDGDHITKGQLIGTFDRKAIESAGYKTISPIVVTNSSNYQDVLATDVSTIRDGSLLLSVI